MGSRAESERTAGSITTVLRQCLHLMLAEHGLRWVLLVVLAVLVAATEALGALLVLVLLGMVTGEEDQLSLPVLGDLTEILPGWERTELFLALSAFIAMFFLLRAALLVLQAYAQSRVVHVMGATISTRLLRGYLTMPYTFHLVRNSSQLIRNTQESVNLITRDAMVPLLQLLSESILAVGLVGVLLITAPTATVLALVILGPLVYLLLAVVQPRVKRLGKTSQEMSKSTLQFVQQSLQGVREIKVIGREEFFVNAYSRSRHRFARAHYLRDALKIIPRVGVETALIYVIIAFFGFTVVTQGSAAAVLPVLGLFAYAALRLKPPLNNILNSLNALRFAGAALDDVGEDLRLATEERTTAVAEPSGAPMPFREALVLEGVRYRYPGTSQDVLNDIDLEVPRGHSIGLIGPTGGGKSTLVDLILGLLEPTAGRVLVDDVDIAAAPRSWQRNLGVVPQAVFLLDDTLRHNIALGLGEGDIDDDVVRDAVRMAQLEDVVANLPEGLETVVGERGIRLSGGQRQRVAIARALYRDPEVLVFDEATSALDNRTEAQLLTTIRQLHGQRTIITVAHRLTTVQECDEIFIIEDGRIADAGTYVELAARSAIFQKLAQAERF